jgi:hypothetical protein
VTAATGGVVALVGEALVDFVQPGPEPLFEPEPPTAAVLKAFLIPVPE